VLIKEPVQRTHLITELFQHEDMPDQLLIISKAKLGNVDSKEFKSHHSQRLINVLPLCHMGILLVWFSKIAIQDFFVAICIWSCQHLTLVYTNEQQKKAEKTTMF